MRRVTWKLHFIVFAVLFGAGTVANAQEVDPESDAKTESPLLIEPKTPEEIFQAVMLMHKLARPAMTRLYLAKLNDADIDDDQLMQLRDKHGPAIFLRLANSSELQPLSTQLLDRVNQLVRQRAFDPSRIDALIDDLFGTVDKHTVALVTLKKTGPIIVPRLLKQIAGTKTGDRHNRLIYSLSQMGKEMVPPLLGALESPNDTVRVAAIEVLGLLGSKKAIPYLWHPAFAPDQLLGTQSVARIALGRILQLPGTAITDVTSHGVAGELKKIATLHFRQSYPWKTSDDGTVTVWSWQQDVGNIVAKRVSPEAASYYIGSRFAKQALDFSPEKQDIQALFLALALVTDASKVGWENALPTGEGTAYNLALTAGRDTVNKVLRLSLESTNPTAALAALQVLGQISTRHQLTKIVGRKSPLLEAMNYSDQRVQFAAAVTILQLDPDRKFRGSQRLVSILTRALLSTRMSRSLVVDADIDRSVRVAGFLGEMGYPAETMQTGRQGFQAAVRSSDVSLILLQTNTIRWPLSQTIANLRADSRTANIPIVIYGPEGTESRVEPLLRRYSLVTHILDPITNEALETRIGPFLSSIQTPSISAEQRAHYSATALEWLAHIAASHRTNVFDLAQAEASLTNALNDPKLTANAIFAISAIPSRSVQSRLQDVALAPHHAITQRESALLHLTLHIQRHGLLLSKQQVALLKSQWESTKEPELKTALAAVIGSLKPNARRVGARLKNFPSPALSPAKP